MNGSEQNDPQGHGSLAPNCVATRDGFSAYLDGALDGRAMGRLASHLDGCAPCHTEFGAWRSMQEVLGDLGPVEVPETLQAELRDTLASELTRKTHLSPRRRLGDLWHRTLAPAGLRFGAGLAAALLLIGSSMLFVGSAAPVQANDDKLADFHPPHFLYSQVPPDSINASSGFVAVLVDAKVDAEGRVYDYALIEGPSDRATRSRVESNLLGSIFRPATVFGVPVPAHTMITYTAMSVRG